MKKIKGIFKIFRHAHGQDYDHDHLIGRVMFDNNGCKILEDHDGSITSQLHEGPQDESHGKALDHLAHSGYFKVVPEEEIDQGLHEELIPDLDIGDTTPDHEYLLIDPANDGPPHRIEVYNGFWILNGRNLNPEEKSDLLTGIREGRFQLFNL